PRRRARERAVAPRWTEALVRAHVTAGAHEPARLQRGVEARVRGTLLRERRVAAEASERVVRRALHHLDELSGYARSHRLRVQARAPVGELHRMTCPARLRCQRRFDVGIARRRRALRRERGPPVSGEKFLHGVWGPPVWGPMFK